MRMTLLTLWGLVLIGAPTVSRAQEATPGGASMPAATPPPSGAAPPAGASTSSGATTGGATMGQAQSGAPAAAGSANPAGVLELSIEDAIRRAQGGSEQVDIARAGVTRAEGQKIRALSEWLPQVNASASYDRTLASEYEGIFEGTTTDPTTGDSENPFSSLPFGQENTYRFGISATYNLFAGGRSVAQGVLAEVGLENSVIALDSAKAEAVLQTAQAYYNAVLADQLLAIAESTLKQSEETLNQTRLSRQVGQSPEFDLLRAQVTFDNQKPVVLQRRYARELAVFQLKQVLDLPLNATLRLTSKLDEGSLRGVEAAAREAAGVPANATEGERTVVRQAELAIQLREASLRVSRSQWYPSLNLSTQYGRVAYPEEFFPGWSEFRTNWTAGLSLSIPIFTGFRLRGDLISARADLIEARARLKQTRELAQVDSKSAVEQLESAQASWQASAGTVEQARRAYQIAELRYREGVSTQLELSDARLLLEQAEANRAQAARDLQVARIRVQLLPYLPLSAGGTGSASAASATAGASASMGAQSAGASSSQQTRSSGQQGQASGASAAGY